MLSPGSHRPNHEFSCPHKTCHLPNRRTSLPGRSSHQLEQLQPTWISLSCQPMQLFKQVSHIVPWEPGGAPSSCYHKAPPTVLSALGAASECTQPLYGPVWCAASWGWAICTNKWVSISSLQCWALYVRLPILIQDRGYLPCPTWWIGGDQDTIQRKERKTIQMKTDPTLGPRGPSGPW